MQLTVLIEVLKKNKLEALAALLFCLSLVLLGPISITTLWVKPLPLKTLYLLIGFLLLLFVLLQLKLKTSVGGKILTSIVLFSSLLLASDYILRHYAILEGLKRPRLSLAIIAASSAIFYFLSFTKLSKLARILPLGVAAYFSVVFLNTLNFGLLFSDDHPTFAFRLETLKQTFPFFHSYNPLWNAGMEFRDYYASGALGIFILFSPLIYTFGTLSSYSYMVAALMFMVPVVLSRFTCNFLGLPKTVFYIHALLSITVGSEWYRWGLSFGTIGFILSCQLLPFVYSFFYKLTTPGAQFRTFEIIISVILTSLMLLWPLSVLFILPFLILFLISFKTISANKSSLATLALLILLNLPWMIKFNELSKVGTFLEQADGKRKKKEVAINEPYKTQKVLVKKLNFKAYFKLLRKNSQSSNPFLILFGLAGLALLPSKKMKLLLAGLVTWLFMLSTFGAHYLPQLELDRFALVATYLLALPAAFFAYSALEKTSASRALYCMNFLIIASFIVCGLRGTKRALENKTLNRFNAKAPIVEKLSNEIQGHSGSGRTIFAGFILHELSNGHLAPLVYTSGKPLIARSYKHDHWEHHEVIPARYLKDKGKRIEEFFDLYNVTAIVTFNAGWRDYFQSKKGLYKEMWHSEKFRLFTRSNASNTYFYQGGGKIISQNTDNVEFTLNSTDAVLKFNYIEGLKAGNCEVYPRHIEGAVSLVGLRKCEANTNIKLSF